MLPTRSPWLRLWLMVLALLIKCHSYCDCAGIVTMPTYLNNWNPGVHFHYTPTHASWVNLIECFFSILSKQGLAHSVQHSKQDLKKLLNRFIASYNETCDPFTWTKGPEHLQRIIETTKEYQALHPRKPRRPRAQRRKAHSRK